MRPVKRIEILTGVQEFTFIERVLKRNGIDGYMVVHDVSGEGNRHLDSVNPLTGQPENRLIKATCPPDRIDDLIEALRPVLDQYGGTCIVYDAESLILSHDHNLQSGGREDRPYL